MCVLLMLLLLVLLLLLLLLVFGFVCRRRSFLCFGMCFVRVVFVLPFVFFVCMSIMYILFLFACCCCWFVIDLYSFSVMIFAGLYVAVSLLLFDFRKLLMYAYLTYLTDLLTYLTNLLN